jgi:hypothetical protein
MTRRSYAHLAAAVLLGMALGLSLRNQGPAWFSWSMAIASLLNIIIARRGEL